MTTEQILEQVADYFKTRSEGDEEYYSDENHWGEYEYIVKEDFFNNKDLEWRRIDDMANEMIDKLKTMGVSGKEIRQILYDASKVEYNDSVYYSDNSLAAVSLGEEEEIQIDATDNVVKDPKTSEWYDWKEVVNEIKSRSEEDEESDEVQDETPFDQLIEVVEKQDGYYIRNEQEFLEEMAAGTHDFVTLHMGQRMLELILDTHKFIMDAKRFIKDMKILKKQGEKFPALTKVMRSEWI